MPTEKTRPRDTTVQDMIQQIRSRLPPGVFEDKSRAFWVPVKGAASREDHLLDEEGVTIEEAGVFE